MLLAGAAFQPAQASPPAQIDDPDWTSPSYHVYADFDNKPDRICPGDRVLIRTYLHVSDIPPSQRPQPDVAGYYKSGIEIMVSGESHGAIYPRTAITRMMDTSDGFATIAPFTYVAEDPGTEQLTFEADNPPGLQTTLEFEVEDCTPLVAMIYRGMLNAAPVRATYAGVVDPTKLDKDGENQYRAAAPFQLAETFSVPGAGCSVGASIAGSQANIDAVSQDQTTSFTITFQPTDHTVNVRCPGGGASATGHWGAENLGPVEVTTPLAGGVARFSESHTAYHGEYTVIVERVVNESGAALPGTVLVAARP